MVTSTPAVDLNNCAERFLRRADIDGADIERAGLLLRRLDEIRQGLVGRAGLRDEDEVEIAHARDRNEIGERIELQVLEQRDRDRGAVARTAPAYSRRRGDDSTARAALMPPAPGMFSMMKR